MQQQAAPTRFRQAWLRWKALRLPWRKRFLVGLDLQGNTFWEFHDALSHKHRMRRIVEYPRNTQLSEVNISPQWHQWLRHTRTDPPTLTEQSMDLVRQRNLKILAAEADKRWAAKPSFLDRPLQQQQKVEQLSGVGGERSTAVGGGLEGARIGGESSQAGESQRMREREIEKEEEKAKEKLAQDEDPWKKARGGPSEEWQPQAWDGNVTPTRRGQ